MKIPTRFTMAFILAAAAFGLLAGLAAAAEMNIRFFPLSQPGWQDAGAFDIDDSGRVVGVYINSAMEQRGFLADGKSYTTIHPPGWEASRGDRIAPNGLIVGNGTAGGVEQAFIFDGGVYTTLLPAGWTSARGMGINSSGQVVGYGNTTNTGFIYSGGLFTPLMPPGATSSQAMDINEAGQVVGSGWTGGISEAFLYSGGAFTNPAPASWTHTEALRINGRGDILGRGNGGAAGSCWLKNGGVHTPISPPGLAIALCTDLTESGAVLGLGLTFENKVVDFVYRDGMYYFYEDDPTSYIYPLGLNESWVLAGYRLGAGGTSAEIGYILPTSVITANGEEGAVGIGPASPLSLAVSLVSWAGKGRRADWWMIAQTPSGIYSFDPAARTWRPGIFASSRLPVRNLGQLKIPPAGKSRGIYTYYFGVDLISNGRLDFDWWLYDRVTVFVR